MGSTKVSTPEPPKAPTAVQTATDFASAMPVYYKTALEFEPQIAQMQQGIQQQLYPYTAGLQEQLAQQAQQGMSAGMPEIYRGQVSDAIKSQFGRNAVYNPIGQQQYGIGMADAERNWQQYYQNMGLSLAGRQPLTQPNNMMQSYTPAANMNYASTNYGNYSNLYGSMYPTNQKQQQAVMENTQAYAKMGTSLVGGMMAASSNRYKKNIKLWE